MRRTVPPSAEIEEQIDQLLAVGGSSHETAVVVVERPGWRPRSARQAWREREHRAEGD
ncbi:MAG: hypothetical protein ICV69_02565 [Thermoleophilaceae bacterium]|nr:hypothetical protein [Thermoleophilaceae bacterium]